MIRRALSCQAAVLVGMASLLLITDLGLAVDAAQHHLMPVDQGIRGWVQPMRSSVLDGPMRTVSLLGEPTGLIALIVTASGVFTEIEDALNVIWKAPRTESYLHQVIRGRILSRKPEFRRDARRRCDF